MSARWWIAGPSIGPFHTTLDSGRIGGRRIRCRRPYWRTRFTRVSYWLLGLWALEAEFWVLYGTFLLTRAGWRAWRSRSAAPRASRVTI